MTTTHTNVDQKKETYRILSLDGGGAKGFYTLGILKEIEALIGCPLCERFDLVFGTSTGAILAALIALGYKVDDIHNLYLTYVPTIMKRRTKRGRSAALTDLATHVFGDKKFGEVKTGIGIIATRWVQERPMIFKANVAQAHGRQATFSPGFGVSIGDAVQASCSAYPLFCRKTVTTSAGDKVELIDGGYCANNPTLYAIADALVALKLLPENIRVVSVGVGVYPKPKPSSLMSWFINALPCIQLLQKTLEINTQSMDQLRTILYKHVPTIRISETFERLEMATDFMEYDLDKLNMLRQRGVESYAKEELRLKEFLL
jgi:patatin-like phospholipase/acyl hydrolase